MRALLVGVVSYTLGCLNAAYYVVRARSGTDVRALGSGNAGARNVLRTRGRGEAVAVVVLDMLKGTVAVLLARVLAPSVAWAAGLALLLVVAGHVWPAQLRFRGGKGAATYGGAMLALSPLVTGLGLGVLLLTLALSRNVTAAGLAGIAATPPILAFTGAPYGTVVGAAAACAIVLALHHPRLAKPAVPPGNEESAR